MSDKVIKMLKRAHRAKYGAPLGKRKCQYRLTKGCLGIADEKLFKHRKCRECVRAMHRELYYKRKEAELKQLKAEGKPKPKLGRPVTLKKKSTKKKS
jgi:hypothetical protein